MKRTIIFLMAAAAIVGACKRDDAKCAMDHAVVVKTTVMEASSTVGAQSYSGTIEAMSGTSVSFSSSGTIRILSLIEGQAISEGQFIGEVDASTAGNAVKMAQATAAQAEAGVRQAKDALHQAEDAYARMKKLHDSGSLTEIQWVDAQTKLSQARSMVIQAQQLVMNTRAAEQIARKGKADTRLYAPSSGYVVSKSAEVGQNVLPGQPVAKIVKIDQVKVKISIPEEEISQISLGQTIEIHVSSLNGRTYRAKVTEKGVLADPISRSYEVKAMVANTDHKLLPGMLCDVYLNINDSDQVLALPANLIQIDADNKPFVWIVKDGGTVHKVQVTIGDNVGNNVIITSGLSNGDKVIVEGQQKVSEGMSVKEK